MSGPVPRRSRSPSRVMAAANDFARLVVLSARLLAGRRYWVMPLLPLPWSAFQAMRLVVGWREEGAFEPVDVQNLLVGVPLAVLAVGLGVRIIAGEMDRRTLEIAYTVPGGGYPVWLAKLVAGALLIAASELLLVLVTVVFFTSVPFASVYGALQAGMFYLVTSMALAALFANEVTGAMVSVAVLVANGLFGGLANGRFSPFFNPLAAEGVSPSDLIAWTIQNRVGYVLAIAAITALAFARADRREKLLS